jgi:hypothetical protein
MVNESLQLMQEVGYKKVSDNEYRKWVEDTINEKIEKEKK